MAAYVHPRTCIHPHMRAHLQQYDHSHSALARHSSAPARASTSHRHICAAQPIPLTSLWPPKAEPSQIRKRMRQTGRVSSSQ